MLISFYDELSWNIAKIICQFYCNQKHSVYAFSVMIRACNESCNDKSLNKAQEQYSFLLIRKGTFLVVRLRKFQYFYQ